MLPAKDLQLAHRLVTNVGLKTADLVMCCAEGQARCQPIASWSDEVGGYKSRTVDNDEVTVGERKKHVQMP